MSKFEEYEKHPDLYRRNTLGKAAMARELGLEVMLCLDWHNTASGQSSYHEYRYLPRDLPRAVETIIGDVRPDVVQVANEPYYVKNGSKMTTEKYAGYVHDYVKGMKKAGFRGLMVANQSEKDRGDLRKAWEWHVDWDYCAEGKHRDPRVLHTCKTADCVIDGLNSNAWATRSKPRGWKWPVFQDEFSSCGKGIHSNTIEGGAAMLVSLDFFKRKRVPFAWLTMGGTNIHFGGEGGWGMHTQLVNSLGEVSISGREMLAFLGKPQYDDVVDPPVDPPDDPPGTPGWYTVNMDNAYLKFTGTEKDAALAVINAGGNHVPIHSVAFEPQELQELKLKLERL